ncbi:MAG TPA: UvrD-helicase domain-containing protein [Candidatus Binataceae bacterium]|nr:UvrD-helicase domain-containing protein [Candidatus Binataceae bacterium]
MNGTDYARPAVLDRIILDAHRVIEANAGTGKTYAVEHLVIDLLVRAHAPLEQILAVTFTVRAAAELRARIRGRLDRALRAALAHDQSIVRAFPECADLITPLKAALFSFERAPIHTIHSFCQRILSEMAFATGARFALEKADGKTLFHEAFRAVLRDRQSAAAPRSTLLGEWMTTTGKSADAVEKVLCELHSARYQPGAAGPEPALEARLGDMFLPQLRAQLRSDKERKSVIDYDDMLERVFDALKGERGAELAAALRTRYRFALIDEFQDTDDLQWGIFRKIFVADGAHSVLYLIGDPKQSIYSFRGADVHAYLRARDQICAPPNDPIPLVENFRSTAPMLETINTILDQDAPAPLFNGAISYRHPSRCGRPAMRALQDGKDVAPITLMKIERGAKLNAGDLRSALSSLIATTIKDLTTSPAAAIEITDADRSRHTVTAEKIYILTFTNTEGHNLAEYLRAEGVPYAFYRREGLFQTAEASDILDLLRAIAAPNHRSHRLKAWATPFFAVPIRELGALGEPEPSDPLMALLLGWHTLAKEGDFAELFESMIEDSGLSARELFLASSLRELTNYQHILELLLEETLTEGWSIAEIIDRLAAYIAEHGNPAGEETNLLRLESERAAVQIMTVHKAKGLEADVVFLFGGFYTGNKSSTVKRYHDEQGNRRLAIGKQAQDLERTRIKQDEAEEAQRQLYVAITRASAKLYLPYCPDKSTGQQLRGTYAQLNRRLSAMDAARALAPERFEILAVKAKPPNAVAAQGASEIAAWQPPAHLIAQADSAIDDHEFTAAARRSAPLWTASYTALARRGRAGAESEIDPSDFKRDRASAIERGAEPGGGAAAGIFLHEVIEKLDLAALAAAPDAASWSATEEVRELFSSALHRHQVPEHERWMTRGPELVFNALRSAIAADAVKIPALAGCESLREMGFTFPIPERSHHLLDSASPGGDPRWRIERGVYVGFVDFVFRYEGRVYFADWKSDLLESYEPARVEEHALVNYSLQAKIYTIGVLRMLAVRSEADYETRFGGLLYLFIRGITPDGGGRRGVYFHRPPWSEIVRVERELMNPYEAAGLDR